MDATEGPPVSEGEIWGDVTLRERVFFLSPVLLVYLAGALVAGGLGFLHGVLEAECEETCFPYVGTLHHEACSCASVSDAETTTEEKK